MAGARAVYCFKWRHALGTTIIPNQEPQRGFADASTTFESTAGTTCPSVTRNWQWKRKSGAAFRASDDRRRAAHC